jgi:adenylyltransferase/sulfurtransferase
MEQVDRYHRQRLLPQIGDGGQEKLARSRVLLVGCGALGTVMAEQLVRAGVGFLRICDRDLVERTNLQRQVLFDEADAESETPKAVAAKARLGKVNSGVEIDARVVDVHSGNIEGLLRWGNRDAGVAPTEDRFVDLILDGTDNVETRYLVNDVAVKHGVPWVYGACVGVEGRVMGIVPGKGPCLRCIFEEPAGVGELGTCDTVGVLGPAAGVVASLQVTMGMKILLGEAVEDVSKLVSVDLWDARFHTIDVAESRRDDCPCCGRREFPFLERPDTGLAAALCGRGAVQVRPGRAAKIELEAMWDRLRRVGEARQTPYFVKCRLSDGGLQITVFPDGRALVGGTADLAVARSLYARYVGT